MTAKWFLLEAHHTATSLLDSVRGLLGGSFWLS
jgi:hypothetical protein